jgi:glycosyltransferase involved in cell wall biosynthesis
MIYLRWKQWLFFWHSDMRIALDGAGISQHMTGVGRYFQCLLRELIPLDSTIEYTLFLKDDFNTSLDFANLSLKVLPRPGSYFLWQNTLLARAVRRGNFDLFWSPNYTLPLFLPTPSLVTVHDISWESLPGEYPPLIRLYKLLTGRRSMKKAKLVFTVSDFSRAEIVRHAAIPENKIIRIHEGVTDHFQQAAAEEVAAFKARYGIFGKRLLGFLGSFFKRRNVPELIASMEILRERNPDVVLMLVGENHAVPSVTLDRCPSNVLWLRRLPENEINAFYSSLSLFLYMSDYEGFGLPPMEALNCGTVSLLLRRGSLAELYGDSALFVDRPDPSLIARAISAFLGQEEAKQLLLNHWRDHKPYFSWKRAAEEHLREIRKLQ